MSLDPDLFSPRTTRVILPSGQIVDSHDKFGHYKTAIQDQHTEIIDLLLIQELDTITILSNTSLNDTQIDIETTGSTPVAGNYVCLKEGTSFYQGEITAVSPIAGNQYTLTLDTPLDFPYTTASGCNLSTPEMNVDGSVTPQTFFVSPANLDENVQWDVTRMIFSMTDATAMDDGKFGGLAGLTNGVVFRYVDTNNRNIFNAKTNGQLALRMFDVTYIDSTLGPGGLYAIRGRRTFAGPSKNGVTIRLKNNSDPTKADQFQCLIQDDLTGLNSFRVVIQGHVVDV